MKSGALILGAVVSLALIWRRLAFCTSWLEAAAIRSTGDPSTSSGKSSRFPRIGAWRSLASGPIRWPTSTSWPDSFRAWPGSRRALNQTVRRIPKLPERLGNEVDAYLNAIEGKEESIERFKTGYAVVRNSTRYLPLAAVNVTQQAQDAGNENLVRRSLDPDPGHQSVSSDADRHGAGATGSRAARAPQSQCVVSASTSPTRS